MNNLFHPTLFWACDYLSMLKLKIFHVSKRGNWLSRRQGTNGMIFSGIDARIPSKVKSAFLYLLDKMLLLTFAVHCCIVPMSLLIGLKISQRSFEKVFAWIGLFEWYEILMIKTKPVLFMYYSVMICTVIVTGYHDEFDSLGTRFNSDMSSTSIGNPTVEMKRL